MSLMARRGSHSVRVNKSRSGFTLIELSIVLVIIGLIVGGVLVGRDLINAAAVRSQIAQIEKYHSSVNTFRGKYGYLPGDLPGVEASKFGFSARSGNQTEGDGNGVLTGYLGVATIPSAGETAMFWVDLSTAKLIDGNFNTASFTALPAATVTATTTPSLSAYFPSAKIGGEHYIYIWSGGKGVGNDTGSDATNYFGLSPVSSIYQPYNGYIYSIPAMQVKQAAAIDTKTDDGLPLSGKTLAQYTTYSYAPIWTNINREDEPSALAIAPSSVTCIDNNSVTGGVFRYTLNQNNGNGTNCALSFKFQ